MVHGSQKQSMPCITLWSIQNANRSGLNSTGPRLSTGSGLSSGESTRTVFPRERVDLRELVQSRRLDVAIDDSVDQDRERGVGDIVQLERPVQQNELSRERREAAA